MAVVLFEDIFEVGKLNPDGKKFDRNTNCDIYPVKGGEQIMFVLTSTLDLNSKPDDGTFKAMTEEVTLADKYGYVMHGRVFRCKHLKDTKVKLFVSFGGLLLRLTGEQRHVANIEVDSRVFCLLGNNL